MGQEPRTPAHRLLKSAQQGTFLIVILPRILRVHGECTLSTCRSLFRVQREREEARSCCLDHRRAKDNKESESLYDCMLQANGRTPEDSGAALAELLGFWPAGRMSPAVLQAAVERARHSPKAAGSTRSVAQRRSLDSTDASAVAEAREGSAEAARAPLPRHVPPCLHICFT